MFSVYDEDDSYSIPNDTVCLSWEINMAPSAKLIPNSVRHIIFGLYFNQKLGPECIPNHVTRIEFNPCYSHSMSICHIPDTVTHLTLGWKLYLESTQHHMPDSVTHLSFRDTYYIKSMCQRQCEQNAGWLDNAKY